MLCRFLFLSILYTLVISSAIATPHTNSRPLYTHHEGVHQPHHAAISKTAKRKMQSLAAIA